MKRWIRTAAFFVLASAAAVSAHADAQPEQTIVVTGHGKVRRAPDLAIVSFSVETTGERAAQAIEKNAAVSGALAKALSAGLGPNDRVTTTRYSLDPVYERRERGSTAPPKITGYVARNQVRAETYDVDSIGALIDRAAGAGANRVNGLHFALEDRRSAVAVAMRVAGTDARSQADGIADALGVKIVRVRSARSGSAPPSPRPYAAATMMMDRESAPTPIDPGEITVSATLTVTYDIQ